jgi:hypothetical protein
MPALVNETDYQDALRVALAAARTVCDRHRARLLKLPNVIDVSPGYKFQDGWITSTPAVVVTVLRKDPAEALGANALPGELDGVPVDVAPATPQQQLQFLAAKGGTRGTRGANGANGARGSNGATLRTALPGIPDLEPFLEPGDPPPVVSSEATVRGVGDGRGYQEPAGLKLSAVTGAMSLLCHASPDAGWPNLQKFIGGVHKTLTVAMYDFGATYIYNAIRTTMADADGPFILNLDRKSNPQRDGEMTEAEIEKGFTRTLGEKFEYSTAAVGTLFPNAYHIKVAVRDGSSFWLSSGNWQGSNQPEEDAATLPEKEQRRLLSGHNREWHIISDNAKLAKTFESYIKFDVSEVQRVSGLRGPEAAPVALPELVVPLEADAESRAAKVVKIFAPKKFTFTADAPVKVQPLLTPDNYGEHVLKLIQSAKKTLYFQNQYIKIYKSFPDNRGKPGLKDLVDALLDRMESDVDVRIILRNEGDTRGMLQALKTYGFDMERVKLLGGCHNKGIVVDTKVVMVSSQNYSADGVRFNRDAGLIIYHPKVAKYFEDIFLYDWESRATQKVAGERGAMPLLRAVAEAAPRTRAARKTEVIPWNQFYED